MGKEHFFEVFSFDVPIEEGRITSKKGEWWADQEEFRDGISRAIGCYMFALGNKRIKPWYVGKTINSFRDEVFQPHKLNHYNAVLRGRRGPATMFLFPLITKPFNEDFNFAKGSSHTRVIGWLEKTLIGMAYARNPKLANMNDATFLKSVNLRGLMGEFRGRPDGAVAEARRALFDRTQ